IELKADKVVVNVSNSSVSAGNNALEVLQKSPGITVDKDNNISLKGKQGVLITIDGKNQYMSNEEIARLLESMPASTIESLEIIQNPSAKYDAEGNSGIINIKLKRNENLGYNGNITMAGRQGRHSNYNGNLSMNFRSSNMNVYGNVSRSQWNGFNDIDLRRDIPFNGFSTLFQQNSLIEFKGHSSDVRIGADYFVGPKTTLGVLTKLNFGDNNLTNDNLTNISGANTPGFDMLHVDTGQDGDWSQKSFNTNLKHDIGDNGSSIVLDVDYSLYDNPEFILYNNTYMDLEGNNIIDPASLRNSTDINVDIFAAKLDYNTTIGKLNFESGLKFSSVETDNATVFEDLVDGGWQENTERTNQFVYNEDIYAAYINGSTQIGKANLQFGLRLEHTASLGNSVTLNQIVDRDYTNLFPSVSLSHMIGEKHSLSYTFSRRLNRPNYRNLNPFINYLDDFTFQKGNPFLRPQYANSFGINYGLGRSLFVSANYSKTTEAMTEVIEQFSDQNTTFQTIQNLDDFESASLNVTAPIVISEKWTTRLSATTFYHKFNSVIPSGTLDNSQTSYNLYVGNEISLPRGWRGEVTFNYRSSLVWGLFEVDPQYSLDFGLSTSVMSGMGNLKVGMNDVFRTLVNTVDVNQDDIDLSVYQFRDSRRATISFSYRFGNQKVKGARKRKTATEDAAGRITRED
ncbi:MAG: TonB-dependent receptor, partial [Saprospiraceae bacterium]|nr:TonB-dependent receptor [Saprospiraceae bacterium]